jgi:hypothetical protein
MLLGGVLAATMLGLVYLTQTLGANATSAQIAELHAVRGEISQKLTNQKAYVDTLADPTTVSQRAKELGLVRLGDTLTLSVP